MDEIEAQRCAVLRNLAVHAGPARCRLGLSLPDAARLSGLTPEALGAIEGGGDCTCGLAGLTRLSLFLGLTERGLPRPGPPGMEALHSGRTGGGGCG